MNRIIHLMTVVSLLAFAGCTKHEYVITQPTEFAGRLTKQERDISRDAVVYYLVDQSSRVGIRIENTSDAPITLKGNDSYVVTPWGESQPMRGVTIAPHTWSAFTCRRWSGAIAAVAACRSGLGSRLVGWNTAPPASAWATRRTTMRRT